MHFGSMFEWLWPVPCVGCGTIGARWCAACVPGPWLRPRSRSEGVQQVFALSRYKSPAGRALKRAKIGGDRAAISLLAHTLGRRLTEVFPPGSVHAIVPAPSTRRSRWNRGFSVGSILASYAGRALGVPVQAVLTSRADQRLATLDAQQRRLALRGKIRACRTVPGTVLLIDDVLTSGATAEAAATELLGGTTDTVVLVTLCALSDIPRPSSTFQDQMRR